MGSVESGGLIRELGPDHVGDEPVEQDHCLEAACSVEPGRLEGSKHELEIGQSGRAERLAMGQRDDQPWMAMEHGALLAGEHVQVGAPASACLAWTANARIGPAGSLAAGRSAATCCSD